MSTILKALKKLEEERSINGKTVASQVSHGAVETPQRRFPVLQLLAVLLVGCVLIWGWMIWRGTGQIENEGKESDAVHGVPSPPVASLETRLAGAAKGLSSAEEETSQAETLDGVLPAKERGAVGDVASVSAPLSSGSTAARMGTPSLPAEAVPDEPVVEEERIVVDEIVPDQAVMSPPPVHLHVSAIFFDPAGGSMAVVDDLPVMEGTMVNGARVKKIFADKVHFVVKGEVLVVPLSAH